jgi:hypothetical protein
MRCVLMCVCAAGLAAADSEAIWQVGLTAGLAPGLIDGTVPVDNPLLGSVDYELTSSYRGGYGAGIGITRLSVDHDGDGWYLGVSIDAVRWMGSVTNVTAKDSSGASDAAIMVPGLMLDLSCGMTQRWDGYIMHVMPEDWQFDFGPIAGIGVAAIKLEGSDTSSRGTIWQAGLHTRLTTSLGDGWRIGGQCDALYGQAVASWDNTGDATVTALGPTLALVVLYEP